MKNNRPTRTTETDPDPDPALGPLPAQPPAPDAPPSASRTAVLTALRRSAHPLTLAELSEETSLHSNTLREHLEALESQGRVRRRRAAPSGRGRPAWLYEAPEGAPATTTMEYAALASVLAAAIANGSGDPAAEAVAAGERWGEQLARAKGAPPEGGARPARAQMVSLLGDLGFAPQPDDRAVVVRLTRCPLLDTARLYPEVVCGVHLGIVRGALSEWGVGAQAAALQPFSEPGACRLQLPPSPRTASA